MKRLLIALCFCGCTGRSVPPETPEPEPAPTSVTPPAEPVPIESNTSPGESREAREKRVLELLQGNVPEPDLPTDSGGG